MRLGFHSPMPPSRTGVADYSAALVRALQDRIDVVVNPAGACDAELYHIGNNPLHAPMYERALERPGVVVLHDAVLNHFYLGRCDERAFAEEFVYNYGEWHREQAVALWRGRAASAQDERYFRHPMLRRIAEDAPVVVVHNPGAAAMVRGHAPAARIEEIPHLFEQPGAPDPYDVGRVRDPLGPGAYLFGVFGHLRESKRLASILRVFERVRKERERAWLLVAGEIISDDLKRALEPMLRQPGVLRKGYLPEHEFWLHAAAVDACINLRYPAAGETSGIAIRLMGIGKPVLVTAGEETSRFPAGACLPIDAGLSEEEMLAACMLWLIGRPEAGRVIGAEAARHIRKNHAQERVAERYLEVLCSEMKAR
ncbi:MAG: glycosyltransferase [Acidimicrobiia bacterium]|nr:glycosyltransferase [Acidimicrobiia bacterium]